MLSWFMGTLILIALVAGCGGGHQGELVKPDQFTPITIETPEPATEETLAEELSAKRLEELYAKSGIPGWDPGLEEELKKWDHQVKFDVPIQVNKQVRAYLVYFSTERAGVIKRYLSRSTRYLPMIKEVFQEYGLPEDLAYLAMIESGFNPHAYSHAAACGMWQFIRGTAVRYGMVIDSYVDERRDPDKSTKAAAKYLLDLYKQFGSWYLAAASYNCGEGRVQRELNQSNHKNFWELSGNGCLPTETKNYVPQMIAATIIAKNPQKFGFKNVPYLPPLKYELVKVSDPTSLRAASVAVNVPMEEIQFLNPEIRRGVTPPDSGQYLLKLPAGSQELFAKNISLARIEHPAVASRAPAVAKSWRRSSSDRSASRRQVASVRKTNGKGKVAVAQEPKKPGAAETSVNKDKSTSGAAPAQANAAPLKASMFGGMAATPKTAASSSKTSNNKKTAIAAKGKTKAKGKKNTLKKPNNLPSNTRLAKKGKTTAAVHRSKSPSPSSSTQAPRGKVKVAKTKSTKSRSLMMSDAR